MHTSTFKDRLKTGSYTEAPNAVVGILVCCRYLGQPEEQLLLLF